MADDLYDQDFYLWTKAQAEALRAHGRALDNLDYDHIAEELEDLGTSQRQKAESLVRQIIAHLYKLAASRNPYPQNHWAGEVIEFRLMLAKPLTQSIRNDIEADLEAIHRDAFRVAERKMAAFEPDVAIDGGQRWTLPQVLGETDDPLPPRRKG